MSKSHRPPGPLRTFDFDTIKRHSERLPLRERLEYLLGRKKEWGHAIQKTLEYTILDQPKQSRDDFRRLVEDSDRSFTEKIDREINYVRELLKVEQTPVKQGPGRPRQSEDGTHSSVTAKQVAVKIRAILKSDPDKEIEHRHLSGLNRKTTHRALQRAGYDSLKEFVEHLRGPAPGQRPATRLKKLS